MADDVSRRSFLAGLGAVSGGLVVAGRPGGPRGSGRGQPGDRPNHLLPEGVDCLPQVEHIVIYMQENHSYDSYFGMHRRGDGYTRVDGVPQNSVARPRRQPVPGVPRARHLPDRTGRVAELGVDPQADPWRGDGRLPVQREHQRHALLGRHRPALLLLVGADLPAVRPMVRVGPGPDLPEPALPAGRHLPGPHRHGHLEDPDDAPSGRRHDLGQAQLVRDLVERLRAGTSPTSPCSRGRTRPTPAT